MTKKPCKKCRGVYQTQGVNFCHVCGKRLLPLRRCLLCDTPFVPRENRQRYCRPKCSQTARWTRFLVKRVAKRRAMQAKP